MNTNPSRVDCPVDLLSWYVNGTLSLSERKAVEAHLSHCTYCQTDIAQWRMTKDMLHRAAVATPQPSLDVLANLTPLLAAPKNRRFTEIREGITFVGYLLRAQIPLIRHDLWASSALVLIMGWLMSLLFGAQQTTPSGAALAVVAPLITALGLSVVYGPENDAGLEWAMTSPTSPRLVLLCRFVLAFGYNLSLTLLLFLIFKLIMPNVDLMAMVDLWLGPMFFLSSISLFLSLVIGVNAAVAGSLTLWTLRVIALMPADSRFDAIATMTAFWSSTPILVLLAVAFLAVGFTLVKNEELFCMNAFQGILRYEFLMQIRRKTLWIGLAVPSILLTLPDLLRASREQISDGLAVLNFTTILQIFVPIAAGFFLSDRLSRDERLLTGDWVSVSGASKRQYIWGKYLGTVTATLLVALVYWMLVFAVEYAAGRFSSTVIGYAFVAFWITVLPSYLFIGAYCVAVPSVMSLRLFQILFTCYWLWAHQQLVPSVAGTPLTPGGEFAIQVFGNWIGSPSREPYSTTSFGPFGWTFEISPAMTVLNIVLLLVLAYLILFAAERYLVYRQERS